MYVVENYNNGPQYHVVSENTGEGVRALTIANSGSSFLDGAYHEYAATDISFGRSLAPEVAWTLLSPDNYDRLIAGYRRQVDETLDPDVWLSATEIVDSAPPIYNCDWLNISLQSSSEPPQMNEQGTLHITPELWDDDRHLPEDATSAQEVRDTIDCVTTDVDQSYALSQHKITYDTLFGEIRLLGSTVGIMDKQTGFHPKVTILNKPPQAEKPFESQVVTRPAHDILSRWGDHIIRNSKR